MTRLPALSSTARRCAGRGRCRSSASCSRSRPGRCCSRGSGTTITASSPSSGASLTLAPLAALHGAPAAFAAFVHAMLAEYLSFIVLLFALYVVAGGILVTGNLRGTPAREHRDPDVRHHDRERGRHDRCGHDPGPPAHPRERGPAQQRPCDRVLHLPRRQYRWRIIAAGRPAAVRRLPARGRFLLDDAAPVVARLHLSPDWCSRSSS